jgi:hypothetical protein
LLYPLQGHGAVGGQVDPQTELAQQLDRDFLVDLVVLHQQGPGALQGRGVRLQTTFGARQRRKLVEFGAEQAHHGVEQDRRGHRLDQHIADADILGQLEQLAAVIGRDHQHQRSPGQRQGSDLARHGHAVHAGHLPVEKNHLVGLVGLGGPAQLGQCQRAGSDRVDRKPHRAQHLAHHLARRVVVVDHQDASALQIGLRQPAPGLVDDTPAEPGREPEGRAPPRLAVDPDLAAHQLGQPLGDHQAQAGAAVLARGRTVGLLETLEQQRALLGRDADAGVLDREAQQQLVGRFRLLPRFERDADRDRALLGELDRVVGIVDQHLTDAQRVTDQVARDIRPDIHHELQPLAVGLGREQRGDIVEHLVEIEMGPLDAHLVGLELGKVEDVVDDPEQVLARGLDLLHVVELARRQPGLEHQMGHADHGIHRRADLVAHVGQEIGLGARICLGHFLRALHGLEGLALGRDVLHHAGIAARDILVDHLRRHAGPEAAAVLAHQLLLAAEIAVLDHLGLEPLTQLGKRCVIGIQDARRLADQLARPVAEHLLHGAVAALDLVVLDEDQACGRRVEDGLLLGTGQAQRTGRGRELDRALVDQLLQMLAIALELGLGLLEHRDIGRDAA